MIDLETSDSFTLQRERDRIRDVIAQRKAQGLCCKRSEREFEAIEAELTARILNARHVGLCG